MQVLTCSTQLYAYKLKSITPSVIKGLVAYNYLATSAIIMNQSPNRLVFVILSHRSQYILTESHAGIRACTPQAI